MSDYSLRPNVLPGNHTRSNSNRTRDVNHNDRINFKTVQIDYTGIDKSRIIMNVNNLFRSNGGRESDYRYLFVTRKTRSNQIRIARNPGPGRDGQRSRAVYFVGVSTALNGSGGVRCFAGTQNKCEISARSIYSRI